MPPVSNAPTMPLAVGPPVGEGSKNVLELIGVAGAVLRVGLAVGQQLGDSPGDRRNAAGRVASSCQNVEQGHFCLP